MSTLSPYHPYFQGWKASNGKRPTTKEIRVVHDLHLARPGSKAAMAIAMALRPEGTTQPQIMSVLESPHRNKIKEIGLKRKELKLVRKKDGNVVRINLIPRAA